MATKVERFTAEGLASMAKEAHDAGKTLKEFMGVVNATITARGLVLNGAEQALVNDAVLDYSDKREASIKAGVKASDSPQWRRCNLITGTGARPLTCKALPGMVPVANGKDKRGYRSDQCNVLRSAVNVLASAEAHGIIKDGMTAGTVYEQFAMFIRPALTFYLDEYRKINEDLKAASPASPPA